MHHGPLQRLLEGAAALSVDLMTPCLVKEYTIVMKLPIRLGGRPVIRYVARQGWGILDFGNDKIRAFNLLT